MLQITSTQVGRYDVQPDMFSELVIKSNHDFLMHLKMDTQQTFNLTVRLLSTLMKDEKFNGFGGTKDDIAKGLDLISKMYDLDRVVY